MPKGFSKAERDLGEEATKAAESKAKTARRHYLLPGEVEELISERSFEYLGTGSECVVIERQGNPKEVAAINYKDLEPSKAKEIFYLQRIFSTLFPHNFPHFAIAIGSDERREAGITGAIRERIEGTPPVTILTSVSSAKFRFPPGSEVRYPINEVLDTISALNLPAYIDAVAINYALGTDGGVYYLDTVKPKYDVAKDNRWDLPAIREFMNEARTEEGKPTYTDIDKRIVEKSIRRLAKLGLAEITE